MNQTDSVKTIKNFNKVMILLVIISCMSKVFGFIRDIVLTNLYGASSVADAYLVTLSIPDMLLDLLANTTMIGFVPIAIEKLGESNKSLNDFTNSIIKLLLIIGMGLVGALLIFPKSILNLMAPGFQSDTLEMSSKFLRVIGFTILFRTVANIFNAYLNANKYFLPSAFMGVILDVSIIVAIIISKKTDLVIILPLGAVLGTCFQMIFLSPFVIKIGYRSNFFSPVWSDDIKKILIIIIPAAISVGVMQISTMVNKALASNITVGGIAMLNHAGKISYFAENIIVVSVVTVLYPLLSEYYINKEIKQFAISIEGAIDKLLTFLIPITAGLAILSYPIINIFYGHGEFTEENVLMTSILMTFNVLGIVGIAGQTLLTRALFSMKKIKVSAIISATLLCVFIVFSVLFSKLFGLEGIALGTAASYTVGGIVYYIIIKKICPEYNSKTNAITFLKALASTGVMMGIMFLVKHFVTLSQISMTVLLVVVGTLVFFVVAQIIHLKYASIGALVSIFKKK